jgi:hypothetical protein
MNTSETSTVSFDDKVLALAQIGEYVGDEEKILFFQNAQPLTTALAVWIKYDDVSDISERATELLEESFDKLCEYLGMDQEAVVELSKVGSD